MGIKSKIIRAFAPATVANVSCGFDVFGLALNEPGDEVEVTLNRTGKIVITGIRGVHGLPLDAGKNTAGVAVGAFLQKVQPDVGAEILIHKGLPVGSGMGSSAASAAAALMAVNYGLGSPLMPKDLITFAMEAERVACGSAHADNVAPALLGGFVLVRDHQVPDVISLPLPPDLICVTVYPQIELHTREARKALRSNIRLEDAVRQWANTAAFVAGLLRHDYELIGRSMEDVVAEPVRSIFIPGFAEVKTAAIRAGALGCSISGSGPAIFALCRGKRVAQHVAEAMRLAFTAIGLPHSCYTAELPANGARIISNTLQ